jgi:hypothetical protein
VVWNLQTAANNIRSELPELPTEPAAQARTKIDTAVLVDLDNERASRDITVVAHASDGQPSWFDTRLDRLETKSTSEGEVDPVEPVETCSEARITGSAKKRSLSSRLKFWKKISKSGGDGPNTSVAKDDCAGEQEANVATKFSQCERKREFQPAQNHQDPTAIQAAQGDTSLSDCSNFPQLSNATIQPCDAQDNTKAHTSAETTDAVLMIDTPSALTLDCESSYDHQQMPNSLDQLAHQPMKSPSLPLRQHVVSTLALAMKHVVEQKSSPNRSSSEPSKPPNQAEGVLQQAEPDEIDKEASEVHREEPPPLPSSSPPPPLHLHERLRTTVEDSKANIALEHLEGELFTLSEDGPMLLDKSEHFTSDNEDELAASANSVRDGEDSSGDDWV